MNFYYTSKVFKKLINKKQTLANENQIKKTYACNKWFMNNEKSIRTTGKCVNNGISKNLLFTSCLVNLLTYLISLS